MAAATASVDNPWGLPAGDVAGRALSELPLLPDLIALIRQDLADAAERWAPVRYEGQLSGSRGAVEIEAQALILGPAEALCLVQDVTARKAWERQLWRQAFHDPLTGLPNRQLFFERLEQALRRAVRQPDPVAVLFLDLDDFKTVNDRFGHALGDQLLSAFGQRAQSCLRPADTLARLGGDEFAVVLEAVGGAHEAARVADRIGQALQAPFLLGADQLTITASIGIALSQPGQPPADLVRAADRAMYRAKTGGQAGYTAHDWPLGGGAAPPPFAEPY